MNAHQKRGVYRAAVELQGMVMTYARREPVPVLPVYCWQTIERLNRRRQKAADRGWHRAAHRLGAQLSANLGYMRQQLDLVLATMNRRADSRPAIGASHLYDELSAVARQLGEVRWNHLTEEVAVTTPPVTLEGVHFGPFEVCLALDQQTARWHYRAVALEPYPAAINGGITHPHVRDEEICAGHGGTPLRAALAEHRFFDFFMVATQILRSYVPDRAHIRIDQWHWLDCYDCGSLADPATLAVCGQCRARHCARCRHNCALCDSTLCARCSLTCCRCGEVRCGGCLRACPVCRQLVCQHCMTNQGCYACSR